MVGRENVYVLQVGMVGSTKVTQFVPEEQTQVRRTHVERQQHLSRKAGFLVLKQRLCSSQECAWTDIYCEKFDPDDLLPPEPEPEPEPEPMYEPEPEEEPFEFDPGDPDMPRCIPCYIRWWNTYYAPVGYPFLLWERNVPSDFDALRRRLSDGVEYVSERLFGSTGNTIPASRKKSGSARRALGEDMIAAFCEPGYRGDRCEWLIEYPADRPAR